ncbi:MAG: hypothetical protein CFK52_13820 [Chloracidobacterium sp. CP2_5A]|nr:MAG: hypothetical protein CFK52_13820 [Chloracidobacterium sp. CP2_5A]
MRRAASSRPLTVEQINWLRVNAYLPPLILFGVLVIYLAFSACVLIFAPRTFFFIGFVAVAGLLMLVVAALTLLYAYRHYRDLCDGVAQARVVRLSGKRRYQPLRSAARFYVRFDELDELETSWETYEKLTEGREYVAIYSPRIRRCWEVESSDALG